MRGRPRMFIVVISSWVVEGKVGEVRKLGRVEGVKVEAVGDCVLVWRGFLRMELDLGRMR